MSPALLQPGNRRDPSGEGFEHYGSEWDWLSFFWNLHTDGGSSNKFSVDQINDVWNGVSDTAHFCCIVSEDPSHVPMTCIRHTLALWPCGTGIYSDYVEDKNVGKLWEADDDFNVDEGVRNQAYTTYHSTNWDKYEHFVNTGAATKVDY